jgi:alpha-tubulin suppressor-like RCC1 family protein
LSDVVEISAGADHTCARTRGNEIWCWGSNANRQLGVDGTTESSVPIRIDVAL